MRLRVVGFLKRFYVGNGTHVAHAGQLSLVRFSLFRGVFLYSHVYWA